MTSHSLNTMSSMCEFNLEVVEMCGMDEHGCMGFCDDCWLLCWVVCLGMISMGINTSM